MLTEPTGTRPDLKLRLASPRPSPSEQTDGISLLLDWVGVEGCPSNPLSLALSAALPTWRVPLLPEFSWVLRCLTFT